MSLKTFKKYLLLKFQYVFSIVCVCCVCRCVHVCVSVYHVLSQCVEWKGVKMGNLINCKRLRLICVRLFMSLTVFIYTLAWTTIHHAYICNTMRRKQIDHTIYILFWFRSLVMSLSRFSCIICFYYYYYYYQYYLTGCLYFSFFLLSFQFKTYFPSLLFFHSARLRPFVWEHHLYSTMSHLILLIRTLFTALSNSWHKIDPLIHILLFTPIFLQTKVYWMQTNWT